MESEKVAEKLKQFAGQQYLNLETFRKSGVGVPTPVWFIEDGGYLFVRTIDNSGKIKRIRNNAHVRVAPCDARGGLLGEWVDAEAQLVPAETQERVNTLLQKKYGLQKKMFDLMGSIKKNQSATIQIQIG